MLDSTKQSTPTLTRLFNFKAGNITHIFSRGCDNGYTSSMTIEKFSELDNLEEIELMHAKLISLGGTPPPLKTGNLRKAISP